jgi:RNA polymerase sigma factor (sigma-70 family)
MRYSKRLRLFEKLKNDYIGYLTATLWKLTGDADIFDEAIQYALLAVWMNLEKLTGPQAGAYIYRIALSSNSKAWRNRAGKDGQILKPDVFKNLAAVEVVDEETLNLVRKEIARLPEQQGQAVVMRYIEQNDYKAIADKLKCAEDTARSHVSKAINTLRSNLAEMNIQEA